MVAPTSTPTATPAPTATPLPPTATPVRLTPDARNVELVGHLGGVTRAVFAQADYLYVGFGPELAVLDISNPVQPERVGYVILPHLMQMVKDLHVVGRYAYAIGSDRLWVVDVANPNAPVVVGSCEMQGEHSSIASMVAVDGYAYIAGWPHLRVVDVSDPTAPAEVGHFETSEDVCDVAVVDNYVYVVEEQGLRVLDVSNPAMPAEVDFFHPPSTEPAEDQFGYRGYSRVAVADGYAYVTGAHLWIIDVSDPVHPAGAGFYDIEAEDCSSGLRMDILVAKDHVYLTEYPGLLVIDVSDPSRPVEVAIYEDRFLSRGMAMAGDHIYVNSGFGTSGCRDFTYVGGLQVVDISDPAHPMWAGAYDVPATVETAKVTNGHAFVAAGAGGLYVADVSSPSDAGVVSSYDTTWAVQEIAMMDDYAYVAVGDCGRDGYFCHGGVRVMDVSDPSALVEIGFYDYGFGRGSAWCVSAAGDYLYVGMKTGTPKLQVLDISAPGSPIEVSTYDLALWWVLGVEVADGRAHVIDSTGLRVLDVSESNVLVELGFYDGAFQDVALADGYVYAVEGKDGLSVLDVSDPTAPIKVGSYDTPGEAVSVAVAGDYAFVADREGDLRIIDILDPATLTEVGFYDTPGYASDVTVANDLVYVAQGTAGLFVLRFIPPEG
jgi:hypothetical protein